MIHFKFLLCLVDIGALWHLGRVRSPYHQSGPRETAGTKFSKADNPRIADSEFWRNYWDVPYTGIKSTIGLNHEMPI